MPITPDFSLSQDDEFVHFSIICPSVRGEDMEMDIVDNEFHFAADPYLLILHFQHGLKDGDGCVAKYDIETGVFTASIKKEIPGEDFPELVLLSNLRPKRSNPNKIELIDRDSPLEWTEDSIDISKYGFGMGFYGMFPNMQEIMSYIADIENPDEVLLPYRRRYRIDRENSEYNPDLVLIDLTNPFSPEFQDLEILRKGYTSEEKKTLLSIHGKEFLMSYETAFCSFMSISEVVFCIVMDILCYGKDFSCESHWQVSKLSATLSWFELFDSPKELFLSTVRRVLLYNVNKNFDLAKKCWDQTILLMNEGKLGVIKALLRCYSLFEKSEHKWRLNRIYIDPMISWIQKLEDKDYQAFMSRLIESHKIFITKDDVSIEWCLVLLEKYAEKLTKTGEKPEITIKSDIETTKEFGNDRDDEELEFHNYTEVDINE